MTSLKSRLLFGTTTAVAVVLVLAGWTLYALVQRSLVSEFDRALAAKARGLASAVTQTDRTLDLDVFVEELDLTEFADPERGEFMQLWASGHLLYQFPTADEPVFEPRETTEELVTDWVDLSAEVRGRALILNFKPDLEEPEDEEDEEILAQLAQVEQADLVLVLARDADGVDQALATLQALLGVVGLVTLATTGLVLVLVVRRTLRPVSAVSERVAAIGEESLSTRLDAAGVPTELLSVVQRVNGLLERLEGAFERERAFSNDVAHELRTPLAGLRTTLEVAAKRRRSEEEYAEALRDSASIAGQLQSMVERLLQLARLDAGQSAVQSDRYVLADVAVESWEPFTAEALARDLRVELDLGNGLEVSSDRELVELILRNLIENAVTYADIGGEIRISARRSEAGEVSLEVSNSGSRLNQEQADAATQRFWRGDTARTEAGLHCGLGLSLVEKAARALEGGVEFRSADGGEFSVEVTFPS